MFWFYLGLSYFKASISEGNFGAEPFFGLLPHQWLVEAGKDDVLQFIP